MEQGLVIKDIKSGIKYIGNFIQNNDLDFAGIYKMIGTSSKVLYIGKAKNLKNRLKSYTILEGKQPRLQNMIRQVIKIEIIVTKSEHEALVLEASLVRSLKPKYNILLKDDKSYPFIMIRQDHDYGQIQKYRGKKDAKNIFFGPFASGGDVDNTIAMVQKLFRLRNCSDSYFTARSRPCLEYQLKRCSAPCMGLISQEDYAKSVKQASLFMQGKNNLVQQELVKLMQKLSDNLEFEQAAVIRDQIHILNKVQSKNLSFSSAIDRDIVSAHYLSGALALQLYIFRGGLSYGNKTIIMDEVDREEVEEVLTRFLIEHYQNTEEKPNEILINFALENIQTIEKILASKIIMPKTGERKDLLEFAEQNSYLALKEWIKKSDKHQAELGKIAKLLAMTNISRIEAYDNSHIMGTSAVGAMICLKENGFAKNQYRKFNMENAKAGDDLSMMREMLTRRLERLKKECPNYEAGIWPDLLLIDGGRTQLAVACKARDDLGLDNIRIISMAKGEFRNKGGETIFTDQGEVITLDNDLTEMKYLQLIRDEVHRYAITFHRQKRSKNMMTTCLAEISLVGSKRKKLLMNFFGSVENIKNASLEQLINTPGLNKATANKIYEFFNHF